MSNPKKIVGPIIEADFWPKGSQSENGENSQKGEKKMTDVKEEVVTLTKKELEDLITKSTQATIAAMQEKAIQEELKEKETKKESEKGEAQAQTEEVESTEQGNWITRHPKTSIACGVALTAAATLLAERLAKSLMSSDDDDNNDDDYGALVELPK